MRAVSVCRRCGLACDNQSASRRRLPPCYAQQEIDWHAVAWVARFQRLNTYEPPKPDAAAAAI